MGGPRRTRHVEEALVWRGTTGYEDVRTSMLWNELTPQRFPEVIVQASSVQDVVDAVGLARSHGLRVAVRSGGHSWCGSPLRDGGMLIDLSRLREQSIDPATATATVQPGVTGRDLALALEEHRLAFPVGHCGSVALGGYLLSGGLGWNSGSWGPACRSVRQIEAVTADGELVVCDEERNSDLFWAARGAGPGFFAIVTAFRLGLHPLPAQITTTGYVFALADLAEVARWTDEIVAVLPPSVELSIVLGTADPDLAAVPPGTAVVTVTATAFAAAPDEAARLLAPLLACPLAGRALSRRPPEPAPFHVLFGGSGDLWPGRHRYAADTLWSSADFATLLPRLAGPAVQAPSGRSLVLVVPAPAGRAGGQAPDMAFSALGGNYLVGYAIWDDPARDEMNDRWLRETMRAVEPLGTGHYVAETDLLASPSRAPRSYAPAGWERLREIRAARDPEGLFEPYLSPA